MVEITLYSMCSLTFSQYRDLRMLSGLEDLRAAQWHKQEHCGCAEGDLTEIRKTKVHGIAVAESGVNKTCAIGVSGIKVTVTKITNVLECARDTEET